MKLMLRTEGLCSLGQICRSTDGHTLTHMEGNREDTFDGSSQCRSCVSVHFCRSKKGVA